VPVHDLLESAISRGVGIVDTVRAFKMIIPTSDYEDKDKTLNAINGKQGGLTEGRDVKGANLMGAIAH
jgi:hypothetical protein